MSGDDRVLLTGAGGYVGGRLLVALETAGRPLRCMARRPAYPRSRVAAGTEVVEGDVLDPGSLGAPGHSPRPRAGIIEGDGQ